MAKKYIAEEAALEAIMKPKVSPDAEIFHALKKACQEEVKNLPAADVVEVKHGQWSICEEYTSVSQTRRRETHVITWMCSECFASNGRRKTKYCPNCGAKMEGTETHESE